MKTTMFTAEAEIYEEEDNPYITYAKFVLADDRLNGNKKGVEYADFPRLAQSSIGMPVKINFSFNSALGHKGSLPIGHIIRTEELALSDSIGPYHQLVAIAALWNDEFPTEVSYLKKSHEEGKAPGVSWELGYNREEQKNGGGWYKDFYTKAATFVKNPAYGTRTALLALASLEDDSALEKELTALASRLSKGGKQAVEDTQEKEYQDRIKELERQLADAIKQVASSDGALKVAQAELQEKNDLVAGFQKNDLITKRTQEIQATGFKLETEPEKLQARQEFWAGLSDEVFEQYVADLKIATVAAPKPTQTAVASLKSKTTDLPKFSASSSDVGTKAELMARLKNAARGIANE